MCAEPSGEQLAKSVCVACHLFPEPQLLTKIQWTHHVMPDMAKWVGIEAANFEALPDGEILREAGLFSNPPLVSQKEWFKIWDYYRTEAPEYPLRPAPGPKVESGLKHFRVRKVNFHGGAPMISLVKINTAAKRLYVADAFANVLGTLEPSGQVINRERLPGPAVNVQIIDSGLLVTLIGRMFPSDQTEGSAWLTAENRALVKELRRPTDIRMADLNGDKRPDLLVCEFGNRLGRFSWHENLGLGKYRMHQLLDRPGAIRSEVRDWNGDGKPDILLLTAQAREGLFVFYNEGGGRFRMEPIFEQHPSFGYADFQIVDWDNDGDADILTANGDNGDHPTWGKAYHGVRLYLNDGKNQFKESYFYPLEGAYKVLPADFDLDGDMDLAAISFYPDYSRENFVLLDNQGGPHFKAFTVDEARAGRWMVMDAGDLDGDGDIDLALGSFVMGPTTIPTPAKLRDHWQQDGAAILILENTRK